jgi:hypothetical protein
MAKPSPEMDAHVRVYRRRKYVAEWNVRLRQSDKWDEVKKRRAEYAADRRRRNPEKHRSAARRAYYKDHARSRAKSLEYYQKARERGFTEREREIKARATRRYILNARTFIDGYKNKPCADCGAAHPPWMMDFDHVTGEKSFNVSAGVCFGKKKLLEEIAKCDVVCSNCHRNRTFMRRQDTRRAAIG